MKLNVYQTIYVGTIDVDDSAILVALNDGDDKAVQHFISQHESSLDKSEVLDTTYTIES